MSVGRCGGTQQQRWRRRRKALQPQVAFSQEQASAQGGRSSTLKQARPKEGQLLQIMARRMPTVNSVKEQADAELYFEMEFPGKDPDTISFSSKSIESFSSETTNPDSR